MSSGLVSIPAARRGPRPPHFAKSLLSGDAYATIKPEPKRWLGTFAFLGLAMICMWNLNAVGVIVYNIDQLFSYPILILCVFSLFAFHFTVFRDLGASGKLFIAFIIAYTLIGGPMRLTGGLDRWWFDTRTVLSTGLIVAASAVSIRHIVLSFSLRTTLRVLLILSLIAIASIFLELYAPGVFANRPGRGPQNWSEGRNSGVFTEDNEAAFMCCIGGILGLGLLLIESNKWKPLVMASIVVAGIGLILTFSRGGILAFIALMGAQLFISPILRKKSVLILAGAMLVGVIYFIAANALSTETLNTFQQYRIASIYKILTGQAGENDIGQRHQLWAAGLAEWLKSPFIGNGIGSQNFIGDGLGSHNTFIRVLGEAGIIPFLMLVGVFALYTLEAWKSKIPVVRATALGFILVYFFACNLNHGVLLHRYQNLMLGICLGLLAAGHELERLARRRAMQSRPRVPLPATQPTPQLAARVAGG